MTADLVTAAMDPDDGTCLRHPEIHLCRPGPGGEWRRLLRDCPLCRVARSPPAPVRPARGALLGDPCRSLGGGGRFRRSSADRGKAAPGGPPRAPPEPPSRPSDAWDGSPSSGDDLGRGLRRLSLSGQCSIGTDRTDTTVASSTTGSVPSSASGPHAQGRDRRGCCAPATPGSSSAPRDALALTPGAMTLSPASPADLGTPGRAHTPGSGHSHHSGGHHGGYGVCPPSHHSQSSQHSHQSQHSQHSQRSQHSQLSHRSQHSQPSRGSQSRGVRRASACGEVVCGLRHVDPSNGRAGSYTGQVDPGTGLPDGIGTLR